MYIVIVIMLLLQRLNIKKMKKSLFLLSFAIASFMGCKKAENTVVTVYQPTTTSAYTVDGIRDVVLNRNCSSSYPISFPITVSYHDSSQQKVTVAFSTNAPNVKCTTLGYNLPAFAGPWTGVPTFTIPTYVYLENTTSYTAGAYTATITATNEAGVVKTYNFNIYLW